MKKCLAVSLLLASCLSPLCLPGQQAAKPAPKRSPIFVDPALLELSPILVTPPANDSLKTREELAEIHRIERERTPAMISAAEFDDRHEDIFLYASVLGAAFKADDLPKTSSLSAHIRNDAGLVDNPLKMHFGRPRPYNLDASLHPICETNKENSYPSGHSLNGYLYAYALAQILPERHAEILARADEYAHNRVVCEAHYPTDLEASRRVALVVFGYMLANPRFQAELAAAREETRRALHVGDVASAQ